MGRRSAAGGRRRPLRGEAARLWPTALEEDRADRDVTTRAVVPPGTQATATLLAEGDGTVSGLGMAEALVRRSGLRLRRLARDGDRVRRGTPVLGLSGDARRILAIERSLVNLVMHLSGVASATRRAVGIARGRVEVLGTRKTLPGLRRLEKQAIVDGGGSPHRLDLAEGYLVKSNHLAFASIPEAIARIRSAPGPRRPIEVEVRSRAEAIAAVSAGADRLLIDNASPPRVRAIARAARRKAGGRRIHLEASGGIREENLDRYARTGVDAVSLGALTHSAPALPFHLRIEPLRAPGPRPRVRRTRAR
ncbi:MAG TPA: carboxylating nicotinate-nucleotide diphosphorylase [Thermoplasmata archaeon]|nr:carboxylating nicotinate-nucleotide diphosphorylase [Thermoplasmata archaeon]